MTNTDQNQTFREFLYDQLRIAGISENDAYVYTTEPEYMAIFEKAFTDKSVDKENNYQILEFLGDRILKGVMIQTVLEHENVSKSGVTIDWVTIHYENEQYLYSLAINFGFDKYVKYNVPNRNVHDDAKFMSDVFEAFIGAMVTVIDMNNAHGVGYIHAYMYVSYLIPPNAYEELSTNSASMELVELYSSNNVKGPDNKSLNWDKYLASNIYIKHCIKLNQVADKNSTFLCKEIIVVKLNSDSVLPTDASDGDVLYLMPDEILVANNGGIWYNYTDAYLPPHLELKPYNKFKPSLIKKNTILLYVMHVNGIPDALDKQVFKDDIQEYIKPIGAGVDASFDTARTIAANAALDFLESKGYSLLGDTQETNELYEAVEPIEQAVKPIEPIEQSVEPLEPIEQSVEPYETVMPQETIEQIVEPEETVEQAVVPQEPVAHQETVKIDVSNISDLLTLYSTYLIGPNGNTVFLGWNKYLRRIYSKNCEQLSEKTPSTKTIFSCKFMNVPKISEEYLPFLLNYSDGDVVYLSNNKIMIANNEGIWYNYTNTFLPLPLGLKLKPYRFGNVSTETMTLYIAYARGFPEFLLKKIPQNMSTRKVHEYLFPIGTGIDTTLKVAQNIAAGSAIHFLASKGVYLPN